MAVLIIYILYFIFSAHGQVLQDTGMQIGFSDGPSFQLESFPATEFYLKFNYIAFSEISAVGVVIQYYDMTNYSFSLSKENSTVGNLRVQILTFRGVFPNGANASFIYTLALNLANASQPFTSNNQTITLEPNFPALFYEFHFSGWPFQDPANKLMLTASISINVSPLSVAYSIGESFFFLSFPFLNGGLLAFISKFVTIDGAKVMATNSFKITSYSQPVGAIVETAFSQFKTLSYYSYAQTVGTAPWSPRTTIILVCSFVGLLILAPALIYLVIKMKWLDDCSTGDDEDKPISAEEYIKFQQHYLSTSNWRKV